LAATAIQRNHATAAIFSAVERGRIGLVRLLLKIFVPKTDGDNAGWPYRVRVGAMHRAAGFGRVDILRMMLEEEGIPIDATAEGLGPSALIWAASKGQSKIVRLLLDRGAQRDLIPELSSEEDGIDAFRSAIIGGHEKAAQVLLDYGANVVAPQRGLSTLTHIVRLKSKRKAMRMSQFLIKAGARR
jgi:ankyrin repeat protein